MIKLLAELFLILLISIIEIIARLFNKNITINIDGVE